MQYGIHFTVNFITQIRCHYISLLKHTDAHSRDWINACNIYLFIDIHFPVFFYCNLMAIWSMCEDRFASSQHCGPFQPLLLLWLSVQLITWFSLFFCMHRNKLQILQKSISLCSLMSLNPL